MADEDEGTVGVRRLTGDYKKAIWHLAMPITFAWIIQQSILLVDIFWVSGLGADSVAAISIVYPVVAVMIGIGNGLGIGASSAIARSIGRRLRREAETKAGQALLLTVIVSVVLTPVLLITMSPLIDIFGGEPIRDICIAYALPLYVSVFIVILNGVFIGMIRGEGDGRRSMYVQVLSAVVNTILDPILIYGLDMGVAGVAWAFVISTGLSTFLAIYWYFIKKDTYLRITKGDLRYRKMEMRSVLKVGFPEATELSVINFFNLFLNAIVILVAGNIGLALYSTAWRAVYILMIPAQAMGGAMVAVCSAQMGARKCSCVRRTFNYGIRKAVQILTVLAIILFVLADPVASVFTYEEGLYAHRGELARIIRIFCFLMPPMALVYVGSSLLQALENAHIALLSSFLRNVMLVLMFALMAYTIATADSLWFIYVIGEYIGGAMMLGLALWKLRAYENEKEKEPELSGTL